MSASSQIETLIEAASDVKRHASTMFDAYVELPAVIGAEHAAIAERDLPRMEAAAEAKAAVCARIEQAFSELHGGAGRLKAVSERISGMAVGKPAALKECVLLLKEVRAFLRERAAPGEAIGLGVLDHVVTGLEALSAAFEERMREIKPLVEANRFAVQTLLTNYQDSYRFWQQVSEENILSYSAKGTRETTGRLSGFVVRA